MLFRILLDNMHHSNNAYSFHKNMRATIDKRVRENVEFVFQECWLVMANIRNEIQNMIFNHFFIS